MLGPPQRVYYGWFVASAAAATEFANAASAISILTIFVIPMGEEFGWSRTEISGATSLGAIFGAALAPISGMIVDRLGSRLVLALGGLVVAGACFYLASAQTLIGFYIAFTFARTADQGLIKIGTSPVVAKWFRRYRGRAIAMVFFGGALGIIILAPVVQLVISTWGWRAAWVMLGGVMLVLGVLPSALVIRRQPEDLGLMVDGAQIDQAVIGDTPTSSSQDLPPPDGEAEWPLRYVLRMPSFWLLLLSLFAVSTASAGVILHLVPYLTEQGLSSRSAVTIISVFSASGAAATLAVGFISERTSPRLLMFLGYLLAATAMGVLVITDNLAKAYLFAVLQGAAASWINVLAPILLASYYGRQSMGSVFGIVRAGQVIGFALGALIAGVVYDSTGSYENAFILFVVIAMASSLLILLARRP
ncbi:MAG: MFS transporter, partial [Lysobacterales bacterium]